MKSHGHLFVVLAAMLAFSFIANWGHTQQPEVPRTPGRWRLPDDTADTPVFYLYYGEQGKGLYPAVIIWGNGRVLWVANYPELGDGMTVTYPDTSFDPINYFTEIDAGPYREAFVDPVEVEASIQALRDAAVFSDYGTTPLYSIEPATTLRYSVVDQNNTLTLRGFLDIIESDGKWLVLESGIIRVNAEADKESLLASQSPEYRRFRLAYSLVKKQLDRIMQIALAQESILEHPSIRFNDRTYLIKETPGPTPTPTPAPTGS
jgi:hypothetical protein